jgi:hypothetical protein
MRPARLWIAVIFLISCSTAPSKIARRRKANWVWPNRLDEAYRIDNYEITERYCSIGLLCVYIKRDFDMQPIQFYQHHRAILVTLGHQKHLVLINDYFATKSAKVMSVNLNSGVNREIDRQALSTYRRHARPDPRLWIITEAYEFSPDDRLVLMRVVIADVSAVTEEESVVATRSYKEWWYSVHSQTGRVIREYRTKRIPKRWWQR